MKILITGSAGFIGGYLVEEFLKKGHTVVGIDNFSKYGETKRKVDSHPRYIFVKGDVKDRLLLKKLLRDCDHLIAGAAKIGGITYFHKLSYDLLSENERIIASTFDAAIDVFKYDKLKKITVISSSMVYESTKQFPSREDSLMSFPPPLSTYGFQKLSCEYFAKGAWEQYKLPYTIVRPFNCVGVGERRAKTGINIQSGNITLAMSHVVPDLVLKIIKGQNPVHILGSGRQTRCFTYGGDLAEGIYKAVVSPKAKNEIFNISSSRETTILELAKLIWKKINPDTQFRYINENPFIYDVQKRIPDTTKAKKILGFEARTTLNEMLDEVIPWIKIQVRLGKI